MKRLILVPLLLITIIDFEASAINRSEDFAVARSNFWQVPYSKSMQVKVEPKEKWVAKECADFKQILIEKNGAENLSAESVDALRQLGAEDSMDDSFVVTFRLTGSLTKEFSANLPQESLSKIPLFNHTTSIAKLEPFLSGFEVAFESDSLSAITNSLGLSLLPIKIIFVEGKPAMKIFGKDTVCDLMDKKAIIKAKGLALIILPQKEQIALNDFYAAVGDQVNSVLALTENKYSKASRLGYRLSSLISPNIAYSEEIEKSILSLFRLLFKENSLEYSSVWGKFDNKPTLSATGISLKAPVEVELFN